MMYLACNMQDKRLVSFSNTCPNIVKLKFKSERARMLRLQCCTIPSNNVQRIVNIVVFSYLGYTTLSCSFTQLNKKLLLIYQKSHLEIQDVTETKYFFFFFQFVFLHWFYQLGTKILFGFGNQNQYTHVAN